uniref:Protein kinase domain-containing protein n=1 Tax=Ditylenchus dipsaci TaxID=166011 RepID=A0A915EJR4_9BILA
MFYFDEDHTEHGFNEPTGAVETSRQGDLKKNTMPSMFDNVDVKDLSSAVEWRRPIPPNDRFILGAESEDEDYENNSGDAFGSSPDSWVDIDVLDTKEQLVSYVDGKETPKKIFRSSLEFSLDDDSGMGISAPGSVVATDDEIVEQEEQPTELIPLRHLAIGSVCETVRHSAKKSKKLRFHDFYHLLDDHLGAGAYACVRTAVSISTGQEYAVKLVDKSEHGHTRSRIIREVEIFKLCRNQPNIVQLIEWFEDEDYFYMVFEKMRGGQLLSRIQRKVCFTEQEAGLVTRDIATALKFLHDRGIAHRDVKPENILCTDFDQISPVKLCDLDLASKPTRASRQLLPEVHSEPDLASPVGSAEFMAPEVVDAFVGESLKYDKRCDMWSLGVIIYIMLCGYPPFYGECDRDNCGWDQGESCSDCQDNLFHRIQKGQFYFPEEEWANISNEAKDLIIHLLVRDVRERYTADQVLKHAWVVHTAPSSNTVLQTATNLSRNESQRDVQQMNEIFKNHRIHENDTFYIG